MPPNTPLAASTLAVLLLAAPAASAAVLAGTLDFGTFGYQTNDPAAPQDSLVGRLSLQFDTGLAHVDATAGIALLSLNYALGSPIAFSYDPGSDILRLGGLAGGIAGLDGAGNDMLVTIQNLFTPAADLVFGVYTIGPDAFVSDIGRHVSFAVPEPATLTLLGIGLLGLAATRRGRTA